MTEYRAFAVYFSLSNPGRETVGRKFDKLPLFDAKRSVMDLEEFKVWAVVTAFGLDSLASRPMTRGGKSWFAQLRNRRLEHRRRRPSGNRDAMNCGLRRFKAHSQSIQFPGTGAIK